MSCTPKRNKRWCQNNGRQWALYKYIYCNSRDAIKSRDRCESREPASACREASKSRDASSLMDKFNSRKITNIKCSRDAYYMQATVGIPVTVRMSATVSQQAAFIRWYLLQTSFVSLLSPAQSITALNRYLYVPYYVQLAILFLAIHLWTPFQVQSATLLYHIQTIILSS